MMKGVTSPSNAMGEPYAELFDMSTPIDVAHSSGPTMRPIRIQARRMIRAIRRFAHALIASIGVVISTVVLVLIVILVFWFASADSGSGGHASSPNWSPTSTILLKRGQ